MIDLTGREVGMLTVTGFLSHDAGGTYWWRARCECGRVVKRTGQTLRDETAYSCGCTSRPEAVKKRDRSNMKWGLDSAHLDKYLSIPWS